MSSNPFERDGLVPGIALTLIIEREGTVQSLATRIEEVAADRITILSPMRRLRLRPNPSGTWVRAEFRVGRRTLSFETKVTGHDDRGDCEFLAMPARLDNAERRDAFRLSVALRPTALLRILPADESGEEKVEPVNATVVDLSAGGMCLVTKHAGPMDGALRVRFTIGEFGEIQADARVVSIEEPAAGYANTQVHCQFVGLGSKDRDRIVRFLYKQQLAMRQSGRL